jgi:hypothetical protein
MASPCSFLWGRKRSRSENAEPLPTVAQVKAAALSRDGGRFVKPKAGATNVAPRSADERLRAKRDAAQKTLRDVIQEHKEKLNAETTQWTRTMHVLNGRIAAQETALRSLRRSNLILKRKAAKAPEQVAQPQPKLARKLIGGTSAGVKSKLASEMEDFLILRFATKTARQHALYEHYRGFPEDYSLVINSNITEKEFEVLCDQNPHWLTPIRKDVIDLIEKHWSTARCLGIQIHCKVGHGAKYQDLIHFLGKCYIEEKQGWERVELYFKGSKIFLPLLKGIHRVNNLRDLIHAEVPIMQDATGKVAWVDLSKMVLELVGNERTMGYLKERAGLITDKLRLHWGSDAAQYMHGVKTAKTGVQLLDKKKVTSQAPRNFRTVIQAEGKDNYGEHKKNLEPMFPVMDDIAENGVSVGNTKYEVKQSLGGDYVFLAEGARHSGHAHTCGCFLCNAHKNGYGKVITNASGKRVPMEFRLNTLEELAAAAHRPLSTGPDIKCHCCGIAFPDQATVDALEPPANKSQESKHAATHLGMRFGTPPLFKFPLNLWYLCCLHALLWLVAITFQRTIELNLDTTEKADAINEALKALDLGCKKVGVRKKDGNKKMDTEPINFIGR